MHFLLWTKESHENTNFDIFKCFDENLLNLWCHFPNHISVFLQILHDSSVSWNILILPCTFLGQTLYNLHKRDQSKCKYFRLFSVQIKIHQILVISETKNKFLFRFCTAFIVCIGVSTPPLKSTTPSFLPSSPPLKSTNCPSPPFSQSPPLYWFFVNPPLKVGSFRESQKY